MEGLFERHPQTVGRLCASLPEDALRTRCEAVSSRQHLWGVQLDADVARSPLAPSEATLRTLPSPWEGRAGRAAGCAEGTPHNTCQWEAALDGARRGRWDEVGPSCLAMEGQEWVEDCFFQAAERVMRGSGPGRVPAAVELCLGAGRFQQRCFVTLSAVTAGLAPSAAWDDPAAWRRLARGVEALRAATRPLDPTLAQDLAEGVWAIGLHQAYGGAPMVSGHPVDHLPAEALPFIRAAAARRLLLSPPRIHTSVLLDLTAWAGLLGRALDSREVDEDAPAPEPLDWTLRDQRGPNLPAPDSFPAIPYLGVVRRAWSEDPQVDSRLCLLEAARELGPAGEPLLREGLSDPDPAVQWTAARGLYALGLGPSP